MAEAWARGHQSVDPDFSDLEEDMKLQKASPRTIEIQRKRWEARLAEMSDEDRGLIAVWPENFEAFRIFMGLESYWQLPGIAGGRLTVPPSDVEAEMRLQGVADPRDCFRRVKLMINAARPVLANQLQAARQ